MKGNNIWQYKSFSLLWLRSGLICISNDFCARRPTHRMANVMEQRWCISNNQIYVKNEERQIWIHLARLFPWLWSFFKLIKYSSQYMNPKIHYLLTRCDSTQLLRIERAAAVQKMNLNWKTVEKREYDLWNGIFWHKTSRH